MKSMRIVIADDDAHFRQRVRSFLMAQPGTDVIAEAANGAEAIRIARSLEPDLILMDVGMPVMNGIDATAKLKAEMPALHIIVLSIHELEEYRQAAARCGVDGYVVKRAMLDELLPAIHCLVCPPAEVAPD